MTLQNPSGHPCRGPPPRHGGCSATPDHGRPPLYHVYADHDGGRNLQQQAGDTTPEVHWLDGLPELLRWALRTWPDC